MKKIIYSCVAIIYMCLLQSCSNNNTNNSKNFNPQQPGIADLAPKSKDHTISESSIKLSVWAQKGSENLPCAAVDILESKLLQISTSNGVAGYGGDPSFVLAALVNPLSKGVTTTAPVKKTINYQISFYVANILTGDVYGMYSQEMMGVGDSFDSAAINAMSSIKDNCQIRGMIKEATRRIIAWYNNNSQTFISKVNEYCMSGDYSKAYALLSSVPQEATECFQYAQENKDAIYRNYILSLSADYFAKMQDAIAKSGAEYNPEIGAYLKMIPQNSPFYDNANTKYNLYLQHIQRVNEENRIHELQMEQESKAIERLRLEAEMTASVSLVAQNEEPEPMSENDGGSIVDAILSQAVQIGVEKLISFFLI